VERVWNCTYAKAPVPRSHGDRALSQLYSENGLLGEMATSGGVLAPAVATLSLRAACRSSTWAYRDLSQSILFHPFSGWPFIHTQHKRLLRNPLGSRTISMRSVHRDLKSPTAHLEPLRRRWLRSLPQHCGSGSHLRLLAPGGLHEGAPYRRDGDPLRHFRPFTPGNH